MTSYTSRIIDIEIGADDGELTTEVVWLFLPDDSVGATERGGEVKGMGGSEVEDDETGVLGEDEIADRSARASAARISSQFSNPPKITSATVLLAHSALTPWTTFAGRILACRANRFAAVDSEERLRSGAGLPLKEVVVPSIAAADGTRGEDE